MDREWQRERAKNTRGMPASTRSLKDIMPNMFRTEEDGEVALKDATCSYGLQFDCAVERYKDQCRAGFDSDATIAEKAADFARSCNRLRKFCESPIEHQMVPWLMVQDYHFGPTRQPPPAVHVPKEDDRFPNVDLVIIPQLAFARFRVDFAIVKKLHGHTKIVAIECDGREYHNAERDFRRDVYLKGWDIPTVRASGSAIHRDPEGIARAVARHFMEWACGITA